MNKLLCTFCCFEDQNIALELIKNNYVIPSKKIYIFKNLSKPDGVIMSYNASNLDTFIPNTILINRNGMSNTLYTLNAINKVIIKEIGYLDKNHIINWREYKNKLLTTTSKKELIISDLKFLEARSI